MKVITLAIFFFTLGVGRAGAGGIYCEMVSFRAVDNVKKTERSKTWQKSETQFRVEQTVDNRSMITIANGQDVWVIDLNSKRGVHTRETLDRVRGVARQQILGPSMIDAFRKAGGKAAGASTVEGIQTKVYRRKTKEFDYHIYVLEGKVPRIRRMTIEGVSRGAAKMGDEMKSHILKSQTDINVYRTDAPMDDSLFHPPSGITMIDKAKK